MSILNLGKFLRTLSNMQTVIKAESGLNAGNGWKSPRTHLANHGPSQPQRASSAPAVLTNGDGVLKTVDIAHEVIREALSGHALTGATNLWYDGEVHRMLDPNLAIVHDILIAVFTQISRGKTTDPADYLIHVNDINANTSMARPHGQKFSYLASQLCIIDSHSVHCLSMDRVRNSGINGTGYIWRALSIGADYEMSVQHTASGGLVTNEPATNYVEVGGLKISIFTRPFCALARMQQSSVVEYAYREVPRVTHAPSLVRQFQRLDRSTV